MDSIPGRSDPVDNAILIRRVRISSYDHLGPGSIPVAPRCVMLAHPMRRTVDRIEMYGRQHARQLRAVLYIDLNRLVAQLPHEVSLPIMLESWPVQRIEHTLKCRVRDGTNKVQ